MSSWNLQNIPSINDQFLNNFKTLIMREENKYLVQEVGTYLDKSDYVFLADYHSITVLETVELRDSLAEQEAEFHVVKNSVLNIAAKEREFIDYEDWLIGPTALVSGGSNAPGVAKVLEKFFKEKGKIVVKGGFLGKQNLQANEIQRLAKLPTEDQLKAQLLSLLNTPAQRMVTILQAGPKSLLNVIQAKARKEESAA